MKSLSKLKPEPGLWLTDIEKPTIGPNDLLIKIKKTAICGTDLHIYKWDDWAQRTIKTPMTIGHEFVGTVAEIGSEVTGFKIGERVSGEGHLTCGFCRNCRAGRRHLCRNTIGTGVNRTGCFAEYLSFPAVNAYRVPDNINDDLASFLDPLGNATHTALSFNLMGEDVLITGAGPIGIMAAAIAKHAGARFIVITDINEYRLALARKMGATVAVNTQQTSLDEVMKQLGMREGFDVGLEMSGHPAAFNDMLNHMVHGGHVALLGLLPNQTGVNWDHVIFKGLILKGIYGREMFETWYKMISMLQSGLNIAPIITHHFSYQDFQKGFDVLQSGEAGKVILDWS
jgi:threonine 3-dehydrogenase